MVLALFMWPRVKALGKTLFMGYAFAMAFTLVYTAEHYVFDVLLGWALAALVIAVYTLIDRRFILPRQRRREQGRREQERAAEADGTTEGAHTDGAPTGGAPTDGAPTDGAASSPTGA